MANTKQKKKESLRLMHISSTVFSIKHLLFLPKNLYFGDISASFSSQVGTTFPASALPFWCRDASNVESQFLEKPIFSKFEDKS
jgi:hypothetical protein